MTTTTVVEQVLARAAALLQTRGWRQGPDAGDERLDLSCALSVAAQELARRHGWDWRQAYYSARGEVLRRESIKDTGLFAWNDAPERQLSDVLRVLCGGVL